MRQKLTVLAFMCWHLLQGQPYSFIRFTSENGLSNNVVYATHIDRQGYLWVATHDGLNRYDGYEFRKFLHNPFDKKTLSGNMAIDITEDEQGHIWVLTNTDLHCYFSDRETFERFSLPVGPFNHSNQSASRIINANNRFLLLNLFNGLFVFDKTKKAFRPLPANAGAASSVDLFKYSFFKDPEGNILISGGKEKGVFFFDTVNISLRKKPPVVYQGMKWENETVTSVFRNHKNKIIYGVQEGDRFLLTGISGKKLFLTNRSIDGVTVFIESLAEDAGGNIWIGYGNHLYKYLPDADSVIDLSRNLYSTTAGDHFIIKTICIDAFSNLWIGLYEAGLLKASIRKSLFANFASSRSGSSKLPYASIYGIIKNPDETVVVRYYGTEQATLLDAVNRKLLVPTFTFDAQDSMLMKRMFPAYGQLKSYQPFYKFFDASTRLTFNNGQYGLYRDSVQDYWVSFFNRFERIRDGLNYEIADHINSFYEGPGHIFWIASDGGGLIALNTVTGERQSFLPDESNTQSISSKFVNAVLPDEKKGLWVATRYGLNYFDLNTKTFSLLSEKDGLCNNTIYTMEKDRHGNLWLGTSNGLSCYNSRTQEFINYSKSSGLINSEYNRNATISLSNGWILAGGTEGIDVIMPDSISFRAATEKRAPPLVITLVRSTDSTYFITRDQIELKHRQNSISISFAALDFTQPYNNKYMWKLEPMENTWTYALGKHDVNYAGLPPGDYTFHVKAAGADGLWNEQETLVFFSINTPWWHRWWFLTAITLAGVGLLAGGFRLYYQNKFRKQLERQRILLEKQQAVEHERTRIATDMHDDLGAGLSRIKFLSETIGIKRQQHQAFDEDVSRIGDYSKEMIDKMGEIVWALNEKNDSLSDLVAYTRSYAAEYLTQNGIRPLIEIPEELPVLFVSGEFRRNVFLFVKEALHNIVKHAGASQARIRIQARETLEIEIADDGKGFDPGRVRPHSNGLTNMKKRTRDIGGKIEFLHGQGTTIRFSVPLAT